MRGNGIYKVLSVMIAIALAIYVNAERNPQETRQFTLPLTIENQEAGTLVQSAPANVRVDVTGPRNSIMQVTERDLRANINLKDKEAGTHRVSIVVGAAPGVNLPSDVTITPRDPRVDVVLEAVTTQSKTLEPVFLRPAPAGYSYGTPVVQPAIAYISGPRDAVTRVARLEVVVDVTPSPGVDIEGRFEIRPADSSGNVVEDIQISPSTARVRTELQRAAAEKEVLISPNITGAPAPNMRISSVEVTPRTVLVSGNVETLERLSFISTQEIDINNASSNIVRSVPMILPEGVTTQAANQVRVVIQFTQIAAAPPPPD